MSDLNSQFKMWLKLLTDKQKAGKSIPEISSNTGIAEGKMYAARRRNLKAQTFSADIEEVNKLKSYLEKVTGSKFNDAGEELATPEQLKLLEELRNESEEGKEQIKTKLKIIEEELGKIKKRLSLI